MNICAPNQPLSEPILGEFTALISYPDQIYFSVDQYIWLPIALQGTLIGDGHLEHFSTKTTKHAKPQIFHPP